MSWLPHKKGNYDRFDNPEIVKLLNELYRNEWYYFINFFLPCSKLISKQRVGSKIIKKYDSPKTPFEITTINGNNRKGKNSFELAV